MSSGIVLAAVTALTVLLVAEHLRSRRVQGELRRQTAQAVHELRGPLGTIALGLGALSGSGALAPERLAGLELAVRRARAALTDLEAASRPQAGRAAVAAGPVELRPLLEACVAEAALLAGERPLSLDLPAGPSLVVAGWRVRLAQAVGNLIGNAIEHGDGTVTVTAWQAGPRVRIEVSDEGGGLPAGLVELRRRARRGPARPRGHGLLVVDAVAREHGGELRSAPTSRGARLVLSLPLSPTCCQPLADTGTDA